MSNPFTKHLKQVGESYWRHFGTAAWIAVQCLWTAVLLLVHAIAPFLLVEAGSKRLAAINAQVRARRDQSAFKADSTDL